MVVKPGRNVGANRFAVFLLAGTAMFITCIGRAVAVNSAAAESRILHLPGGFAQPYGSYTTDGEFPGAKAELGFKQEGDRRFARLSFDLTKGAYVGYRVTERIPAGTSRVAFTHAADDAIRRVDPDAVVGVTGEDVPHLLQAMLAGGYPRSSYLGQAACIVRMYLAALEAGCDYACQYDFRNDGLRASYTEHNFGLVHHDWSPKPSYAAVAFLTRHVGQMRYVCDLSSDKHAFRVAEFAPEAGKKDGAILVLWSVEGVCEWEVPASRGPWTECRDLFGNVIEPPVVSGRKLRLTECPIYLRFERN